MLEDAQEKIRNRVKITAEGCWEWQRYRDKDGYGRVYHAGVSQAAHKLSYIAFRGSYPGGLTIDHLCRNRACCNPDHLEPVTHKENTLRGTSFSAVNARKTHCIHGHPLTPENVYRQGGKRRQCRRCNSAAVRRYSMRRADASRTNRFEALCPLAVNQ